MNKIQLKNVVEYSKNRISYDKLSIETYISTDNLLQNKLGVTRIASLPSSIINTPKYEVGNILVSNIRPYLKKIFFAKNEGGVSSDVLIFIVNNNFEPKFVYYSLFQDSFFEHMMSGSKGTKMPRGDKNQILEFEIAQFDLLTQQKIASVLSALDDKIELNNKINAELEQMAKTLYDYWFVQFDFPNEDGKPYKSSGGAMEYNEVLKREIPKGWEVKRLEEIESNIITGKTPSTKVLDFFGGDIPFITIDDIRQELYIKKSERTLSKKGADSQSSKYLSIGDLCISCIGTVGVIGIVDKICQTNQQINSLSNLKEYNRYFLLNALKKYFEFNTAAKQGAVLANMNKGEFGAIPILDANTKLKKQFLDIVLPLYSKLRINLKQNQELAQLRDWLLPMLMNGQVTVADNDTDLGEGVLAMAAEPVGDYKVKNISATKNAVNMDEKFEKWVASQGLAARGKIDKTTLREIFDAMDDDDK